METEYLEGKIKKLLTEAEKLEQDVAYLHFEWNRWEKSKKRTPPPNWLIDKDCELKEPFEYLSSSIYISIVCYLDAKDLNHYLNLFYKEFGEDPQKPKNSTSFEIDHHWSGEPYSVFLSNIRQFLSVFQFSESDDERYLRLSGIQYLERVLKNTATIIAKSGTQPTSEPEVYNIVRNVLEAIFPTSKSPKGNFIKTAKEYKPDILIPELNAAVEYKYATTPEKLKSTVEQIAADVKGYTGDREYNVFYAVFYVTKDFWGEDKFKQVWKDQKFPKNWLYFYKVGN